jgi:hypothetical protein
MAYRVAARHKKPSNFATDMVRPRLEMSRNKAAAFSCVKWPEISMAAQNSFLVLPALGLGFTAPNRLKKR